MALLDHSGSPLQLSLAVLVVLLFAHHVLIFSHEQVTVARGVGVTGLTTTGRVGNTEANVSLSVRNQRFCIPSAHVILWHESVSVSTHFLQRG